MLLFWLVGCVVEARVSGGIDCDEIAMRDASGHADPCDVAACQTCADRCGASCMVFDSLPPIYACEAGSWDVYDVCEDWRAAPRVVAVEDLGCGGGPVESIEAAWDGTRVAVTHRGYATGCCPEAVEVGLERSGTTLLVSPRAVNDLCECACLLDVAYQLEGVARGTWTITHAATGVSTTVVVP